MKHVSLFIIGFLFCTIAYSDQGDREILLAHEAARNGDHAVAEKIRRIAPDHPLVPYVEYWVLSASLEDADIDRIREFLARYSGSLVAERLRADWLKLLARRQQWDAFDNEYPSLLQPEQDILCLAWQSRLHKQDLSVLDEARPLWFSTLELPADCTPVIDELIIHRRLSANDVWERIRRQLEANKVSAAKWSTRYLQDKQIPNYKTLDKIAEKPEHYLKRLPNHPSATRPTKELIFFALHRVSRTDARLAHQYWEKLHGWFSIVDQAYMLGLFAHQAALQHLPEAITWYRLAGETPLSDEQITWKARAALRQQDWKLLKNTIEQMPASLLKRPEWVYWLGRAYAGLGWPYEASVLFESIRGQANFYGNLASEETGRLVTVPQPPSKLSEKEGQTLTDMPGIARALALYRLNMRAEGIKEWGWAMRGLTDRQLLAAADIARQHKLYDRAIMAADKTTTLHDFSLRFLVPYREQIEPKSHEQQLDPAWVYGLMRQESRFVIHAQSSVGAQGLMQVMPATAQWVAKKIGLHSFKPHQVQDMETNVTLGTAYLKLIFDRLDSQPVLAAAAYNAGPSRARKWCDTSKVLEGAIYAETIPFSETRDYVKKVMSNTIYYSALLNGQASSLKSMLGMIKAKDAQDIKVDDLP